MNRKCISCGTIKDKKDLIRVTTNANDELFVNGNSKIFGRSAYICYNKSCIEKAFKKNKLKRALKTSVKDELKGILLNEL